MSIVRLQFSESRNSEVSPDGEHLLVEFPDGSWMGPPQGERAPREGSISIVILARDELSQIGSSAMAPMASALEGFTKLKFRFVV